MQNNKLLENLKMNTYACMCVFFWNQKSIREQNPILVTNICVFEEILKNSQETQ